MWNVRYGCAETLYKRKQLEWANQKLRKAFLADFKEQGIEVSMGFVLTDPDENKNLDDYLSLADKNMYEEKGIHHKKH